MKNSIIKDMGKKKDGDKLSAFEELCIFADEFGLDVEIEKPFSELPNIFLKVLDEGKQVARIALEDITELEQSAAQVLNDLSRAKND